MKMHLVLRTQEMWVGGEIMESSHDINPASSSASRSKGMISFHKNTDMTVHCYVLQFIICGWF